MKKLLALGIALVMVMTMAVVAVAAVAVSGDYTLTYDFNAEKDKDEVNIDFAGKINDQVSWLVRTKLTDKQGAGGVYGLWMNEGYFTSKQNYGSFQFGMWEIKTYNTSILDNGDATFGKLKSMFTLGWTAPQWFDGLIFKVVYMRDDNTASENDAKIANADGAYVITVGYAAPSKVWGFDYNYVETQMASDPGAVSPDWTQVPAQEAGYALNFFVYPISNLRLYVHTGINNEAATAVERMIGGAYFSLGKFYAQAEYNFTELNGTTFNPYGYKIGWNWSNTITTEWRHSDKAASATNVGAQELRVILKFK